MTLDDRALALVPVALLLLLARASHRRFGDWLAPSALFALYWGLALLGALSLAPGFLFWPPASWYVLGCALLFHAGAVLGTGSRRRPAAGPASRPSWMPGGGGRSILLLTAFSGLASSAVMTAAVGRFVSYEGLLSGVVGVGAEYASRRYSAGEGLPLLANLLNVPLYAGQAYAGAWAAAGRPRKVWKWLLLPIGVGLLQALLSNSRTPFVWMMTLMVGGWLAGSVFVGRSIRLVSASRGTHAALALVSLAGLYIVVQWYRDPLHQDLEIVLYKARVAFLSTPSAFSQWLELEGADAGPRFGIASFGGIADLLDIAGREQGLGWIGRFQEVEGVVFSANVYTAFRQIIEDATLPGSFLVWAVLGVVMGAAYRQASRGRRGWMALLGIGNALLGGSYLAVWATYNTCFFGALSFWLLCLLVPPIESRSARVAQRVPAAPPRSISGGAGRLVPGRVP